MVDWSRPSDTRTSTGGGGGSTFSGLDYLSPSKPIEYLQNPEEAVRSVDDILKEQTSIATGEAAKEYGDWLFSSQGAEQAGKTVGGAAIIVGTAFFPEITIPLLGAYANYQEAKATEEAAAAQEAARKKQEAKEQAQYLASKRKQVREQRILQARTMQAAASRGVMGSSGILGATGAATTLFGGALAFQEGQTRYNTAISADMQEVSDARSEAAKWGFVSATAGKIGGMFT